MASDIRLFIPPLMLFILMELEGCIEDTGQLNLFYPKEFLFKTTFKLGKK